MMSVMNVENGLLAPTPATQMARFSRAREGLFGRDCVCVCVCTFA